MLVETPNNLQERITVALHTVKPGRVVEIVEPNGKTETYAIPKFTDKENISVPQGSVLVFNVTTGRLCNKPGRLAVAPLSAVCDTNYFPR